jgi:hypothetical protein
MTGDSRIREAPPMGAEMTATLSVYILGFFSGLRGSIVYFAHSTRR